MFITEVVCIQCGLSTSVNKGVSAVALMCTLTCQPACTSWVFLYQEGGVSVSCLISMLGNGYFVGFSFCACEAVYGDLFLLYFCPMCL